MIHSPPGGSNLRSFPRKRERRGVFKSVARLKWAIMKSLEHRNADPKSFIWTNSAGEIFKKIQ